MPSPGLDPVRLEAALEKATAELLSARNAQGYWEGELSSSALSTATAATAMAVALKNGAVPGSQISDLKSQIDTGLAWLAKHTNPDGGWGDTVKSLSNLSTTTLCWAAFGAAGSDEPFSTTVSDAERWLADRIGVAHSALRPSHSALASAIIARYGKDRTFSVPILTMCALAGRLGAGREAWQQIIPLPFELAALPHQFFAALRLPVVSYALPALIAIGQAHHVHAPSRNPLTRWIRHATRERTLRVLTQIQPGNGGFLEATPLTSFVTMSLAGSGQARHIVTQRGLEFLSKSQRRDGSWPIDTNLATWCTTLAVEALPPSHLSPLTTHLLPWLLNQQYRTEHPYTHAAPGGWAWTDLPGGVPDADDTSGALLAIADCGLRIANCEPALAGIGWLLGLQNRDGGIPTFCRGWGALPFDHSSADIAAHAIRAWTAWLPVLEEPLSGRVRSARRRALDYLRRTQNADGSWVPLWFGNEHAANDENPVYGTARVIKALVEHESAADMAGRGLRFLVSLQNSDGGWSGAQHAPTSVEETALAVEALAEGLGHKVSLGPELNDVRAAMERGVRWLVGRIESGAWREPSPIGFYFAKLWYFERLYPLIFTAGALHAVARLESPGA